MDNPRLRKWLPWHTHCITLLQSNRVRPILMPDSNMENNKQLDFLLEFQASRILTDMVVDVLANDQSPEEAATNAQRRTEHFLQLH
jgi:hypothetical protein